MKIFTIGFTRKSAETFFTSLKSVGVQRIVDVRLNNVSQLAAFAKKEDLRYFARTICSIEYVHAPELAPTQEMLGAYKKRKGDWDLYQRDFLELMRSRGIERSSSSDAVDGSCLVQRGKTATLSPPAGGRVPPGCVARRPY